jgi:copper chaperone CopZ
MACNNQVLKQLGTLRGVFGAEMNRIEGEIIVSHTDEVNREQIWEVLISQGMPERKDDSVEQEIETDEPSIWGCAL